jgi:hypothetical protein
MKGRMLMQAAGSHPSTKKDALAEAVIGLRQK